MRPPLAHPSPLARRARIAGLIVAFAVVAFPRPAMALVAEAAATAGSQLTPLKAAILGLVEGITEFLPVSSTGHLLVVQRLLGIGTTEATKDAADSYAIAIQAGAILAVAFLYWGRIVEMVKGLFGRDAAGRRMLIGLVVAAAPAAVIALAFERPIKDNLLGVGPVIAAWVFWGVVILVVANRMRDHTGGKPLEQIAARQALIIGLAQCLAMWPGTSRSLITLLAALAVGMSLSAAVEFSFLLGLVTLGGATAYEMASNGSTMIDAYGWVDPLIGLVVAFIAAAIAVKWMVSYLQHHSLAIFGWYRLVVAGIALVLLATGAI